MNEKLVYNFINFFRKEVNVNVYIVKMQYS